MMGDCDDPNFIQTFTSSSGPDMEEMWGPTQADDAVRQALAAVWRSLPKSKRTADAIEEQLTRLTRRAIQNYREDLEAFQE